MLLEINGSKLPLARVMALELTVVVYGLDQAFTYGRETKIIHLYFNITYKMQFTI